MSLTKRQQALLRRPLSSLKKLSPQVQSWLIRDAHYFRNPLALRPLKLTPKTRRPLLKRYTVGDVFEAWQQAANSPNYSVNPTGLSHPNGGYRLVIDLLVKAGFTRFDHPWLPQETLTLKVMRTRTKEEWLDTPLCFLGTVPRAALERIAYLLDRTNNPRWASESEMYSVTVRDFITICDEKEDTPSHKYTSPYLLWRGHKQTMTNTQKLLYKLGFEYVDSPVMQYGTDRKAIEQIMHRHKIGKRAARMVVKIARAQGWHINP